MYKSYITQLKKSLTTDDVWTEMKGKKYKGSDISLFEDDKISLPMSSGDFTNAHIKLKKGIIDTAFRTLVFLKLDGEIGQTPINTGKMTYVHDVHFFFKYAMNTNPNITSMMDIESNILDNIILEHRKKGLDLLTLRLKLNKIYEYAIEGDTLPIFLQIDRSIFLHSKMYQKFKKVSQR